MRSKLTIIIGLVSAITLLITGCDKNPTETHDEVFTVTLQKIQNDVVVDTVALNVETHLEFRVIEGEGADTSAVSGLSPMVEMEMMGGSGGHTEMDVHNDNMMTGHYEVHNTFTMAGTYECHFSFNHDGEMVEEHFDIIVQ